VELVFRAFADGVPELPPRPVNAGVFAWLRGLMMRARGEGRHVAD
jgi:hypothetical protein